ncbi:MAG: regulatory signaling modulator protein AmpE [Chromatiaceae bacterium]|nr:regulatory signaling modulator protein AmpE [Gammaproteobacteria bacterium]MCP5306947.1 regulatory signaling modulator protein AmpE [Chromatiaceae bacterium]
MTFFSVLLALFVERVLQQQRPRRQHRWFDGYCDLLSRSAFPQWLMARPWGAVLALLPPLLVVGWLQSWFNTLGGLAEFAFGALVLLFSLGPRDLGEDTDAFIEARDRGEQERASALAQQICLSETPEQEPRRSFAVARAVVVLANRRLIGPILWFVVFGAVGAAAYRAVQMLAERLQTAKCPAEMQRYTDELRHIVDWAPARLTAAGYAFAGNFDAVAHAWRTFDYEPGEGPLTEAEHLLATTGLAALDTFPHDDEELEDQQLAGTGAGLPPVVEDALALVWRSLAMWVAVIAGGSLVAALA